MRLGDLFAGNLAGIERIVDVHEGDVDLAVHVAPPERVEYVLAPDGDDRLIDDSTLVVDLFGPEVRSHHPLERLPGTLARMTPARRAVLLLAYPVDDLPIERVGELLQGAPWRIGAAVPLADEIASAAIVVEPSSADAVALDEHNRLRLTELDARIAHAGLLAAQREVAELRAQLTAAGAGERRDDEERQSEDDELRAELNQAREDRRRIRELERSTTYQVGRVVVDALARPGKRTLKAPLTMARLWRGRSERAKYKVHGDEPAVVVRAPALIRTDKMLTPFPVASDTDLVGALTIVGIWTRETERVLDGDVRAVTLHPNQALMQARRADPDVFLVQASAVLGGSPWAGLGTPVGFARDLEARAVLEFASRRDVRSVLWLDRPAHLVPGLDALADRFDVILRDYGPWADGAPADAFSTGLQLARYGVLDVRRDGEAPTAPCFIGAIDPRLRTRTRDRLTAVLRAGLPLGLQWFDDGTLDELAGAPIERPTELDGARAGYLPASEHAGMFHDRATWIATPPLCVEAPMLLRTLEQLASGANVVTAEPVMVEGELKQRVFDGSVDPAGALAAAAGAPFAGNQFSTLRELYTRASTARWMGRLARACDLAVDPADAAATTIVVTGATAATIGELAASVGAQRHRPRALVVGLAPGTTAAAVEGVLAGLTGSGIAVEAVPDATWPALLGRVRTSWCATVGDARFDADHLLDLHVLQATARTPLVCIAGAGAARVPVRAALVRRDVIEDHRARVVTHDGAAWWDAPPALVASYAPSEIGANR